MESVESGSSTVEWWWWWWSSLDQWGGAAAIPIERIDPESSCIDDDDDVGLARMDDADRGRG